MNWGPWSGVGFGASERGRRAHERLESFGLRRITPPAALAALGALLAHGISQAAVVAIDWVTLARVDAPLARTPQLAEVAGHLVAAAKTDSGDGEQRRRIDAAPEPERGGLVGAAVGEIVARVLRVTVAELRRAEPLPDLGLDSLMAVEIKNRIRSDLGVDVALARFLEGASTDGLTAVVRAELVLTRSEPVPPVEEEFVV